MSDDLYECPWGCPFVIYMDDKNHHRRWHRDQLEDPDVRGGRLLPLDPFGRLCVKWNVEYARTEGVEVVVALLRANGYPSTAAGVLAFFEEEVTV